MIPTSPKTMTSPRSRLIELLEQEAISQDKISDALILTEVTPGGKAWRSFIDQLLLWLGGLALAFAVCFFIAFNWDNIGRFAKFALVEGIIVLAIAWYCRLTAHSAAAKVSLFVATICLGVLLALYGQTYQTGADPWQLFFTWALLMLPWAIIGRFPTLWIVWIMLLNVSLILYYQTFGGIYWLISGSETGILWLSFILNTLLLAAWEFLAVSRHWLSERWAVRLLATAGGVPLTWLVLYSIFSSDGGGVLPSLVWTVWLALMYVVYRRIKPELFMLAGCCLSGMTVIICFIGEHLLKDGSAAGFLILSLLIIGMGTGAAFWLKNVHRECQS